MFSFTPTKNITMGEGGIVTTNDGDLAARLRLLRNHGQTSLYEHAVLGYNWRMTEMQAAIGVVQLGRLDGIIRRKQANASAFSERLSRIPGVKPPVARADREHVYMLYTTLIENGRDRVLDGMLAGGIEARVYFPPAHRQPVFARYHADLPVTESLSRRILSLPFHAGLTDEQLEVVAATLATVLGGAGMADAVQ